MKLLYLSCHEILEYDELKLFHELGVELFSLGDYCDPSRPARLRPTLAHIPRDPGDVAAFEALGGDVAQVREALPSSFVDRFDVVMVMHHQPWIRNNWTAIRHKHVVWRSIGQSRPETEPGITQFRDDGVKIVRYSPQERTMANFAGEHALIRFYKDPDDYGRWTGEQRTVVSVARNMPERPNHCDYELFREVTAPFPCELYGGGNERAGDLCRGELSFKQLQETLRRCRVFFYTGTKPACYTLGFIEAWMTGIPIVALGPYYGNSAGPARELEGTAGRTLYEVSELITDGEDGFVGDDVPRLQSGLELMLTDEARAEQISIAGRAAAIRHFGKETIKAHWKAFFDSLL